MLYKSRTYNLLNILDCGAITIISSFPIIVYYRLSHSLSALLGKYAFFSRDGIGSNGLNLLNSRPIIKFRIKWAIVM